MGTTAANTTTTAAKTIPILVRTTILRGGAAGLGSLQCLGCEELLDLAQLDIHSPGGLVGVCHCCNRCGSCHIINDEIASETMVVMIPSFAVLRKEIELNRVDP